MKVPKISETFCGAAIIEEDEMPWLLFLNFMRRVAFLAIISLFCSYSMELCVCEYFSY